AERRSLIQLVHFPKRTVTGPPQSESGTGVSPVNTRKMRVLHHFPKTAAARRFDAHAIARFHVPTSFRSQLFFAAICANDEGTAALAVFAALQSVRRTLPTLGAQRHPRRR